MAIQMGATSKHSIAIAPVFYVNQADIRAPSKLYYLHHKKTKIKIWLIAYCWISTSTTDIKVMDNHGTQTFIQSFVRFSCKVG